MVVVVVVDCCIKSVQQISEYGPHRHAHWKVIVLQAGGGGTTEFSLQFSCMQVRKERENER